MSSEDMNLIANRELRYDTGCTQLIVSPFLSAAVTLCFLRKHGNIAALLSVATAGGILAFSSYLIFGGEVDSVFAWSTTWFSLSTWQLNFGFFVDSPNKTLLVVSFVGLLIHIFSLGYMADDESKARYFGGLLSMFSMIGITLADNLIMIFVF